MLPENKPNGSLREGRTFTKHVRIRHTDLAVAGTSATVNVGTALPSDAFVLGAWYRLVTDFADTETNITSVKLDVGISGNADLLIDDVEVLASSPGNLRTQKVAGDGTAQAVLAGAQVIATLTASGANFGDGTDTALDAGELLVCVVYQRIADDDATIG